MDVSRICDEEEDTGPYGEVDEPSSDEGGRDLRAGRKGDQGDQLQFGSHIS